MNFQLIAVTRLVMDNTAPLPTHTATKWSYCGIVNLPQTILSPHGLLATTVNGAKLKFIII